jgi:lysophospholipase L1-like esterase
MARQNNKHDTKIIETGIETTKNILSESRAKNELTKTAVHQTPSTDSKISAIADSTGAADSNPGEKASGSVPKNTDAAGSNKKNADNSSDPKVSQKTFKEVFKNDAFIGDSITEGLSFFEFLDEKNVYAKLGVSLSTAQAEIEEAEKLQPENVFLLFGLNDVVDPGTSEKAFAKSYKSVIDSIKKQLPKSNIYVQSVLPVLQKATDKKPALNNERINKFNAELINLCKNEKVTYLDISGLARGNQKLYQGDGIHFMQQFYTSWLYHIEKKVKNFK